MNQVDDVFAVDLLEVSGEGCVERTHTERQRALLNLD